MSMSDEVVIVGAGLSGLCCGLRLQQSCIPFRIVEASDGIGGRIRTDMVDEFQLDRGFQVFLTAYPEAKKLLNYTALDLHSFEPGAFVHFGGAFHRLTDPWRRPMQGLQSIFSPIGTFMDKARVGLLRSRMLRGTLEDRFLGPETTTLQALQTLGFSASMIDRFFRPFLGGIFLDSELQTSSRMFEFVFRMFSTGDATLPAQGMEAIPRQLAAGLPADSVQLKSPVVRVDAHSVELASGETIRARAVIVAVEGAAAANLLGESIPVTAQGVTCLYFAADRSPVDQPMLVLNGDGHGPVNNLCVPSIAAPHYAPPQQHLVSATVLGIHPADDSSLQAAVRDQLVGWYGPDVIRWRHLRTYRIPYALPRQSPPALSVPERPVRWQPGVYVCGDHRDNASIQGAMVSGRRAAEAFLEDFA
jgi:phytoene dehydrogenase-like protein